METNHAGANERRFAMTLSDKPKHLHPKGTPLVSEAWFYEEQAGLEIIVPVVTPVGGTEYSHITIPWRLLRASLKRKDSPTPA